MGTPGNLTRYRIGLATAILATITGVVHGASWTAINNGLPSAAFGITVLSVDSNAPSTLYAVTNNGSLFKSGDGGGSWNPVNGVSGVNSLAVDPTTSSTIYVATRRGVAKSIDSGESWSRTNNDLTDSPALALAIDPVTPSTLYALTYGRIFKSTDAGESWNAVYSFAAPNSAGSLAIDPVNPSTIYAAAANADILKSTDGGESWGTIKTGLPQTVFATSVLPLVIDPVTPSTLYAGSFAASSMSPNSFGVGAGSISKSVDGGATWNIIRAGIPSDAFVRSLAVDPTASSAIYAGYTNSNGGGGVLKSTDGGQNWSVVNTGLPTNFRATRVAISPKGPPAVYAAFADSNVGTGGVFKSNDGGATWNAANDGLAYFDLHTFVIDPVRATSLYSGGSSGLFKSDDAGANWRILNTFQITAQPFPPGIGPPPFGAGTGVVRTVLVDFINTNVLYVETTRSNGCAFNDKLVFKSTDGGATFDDSISPKDSGCDLGFLAFGTLMTMDPKDPNTLYLGESEDEDGIYALLKSTDGGVNWSTIWNYSNGLQSGLNALAIDPVNPTTLYAGVGDADFFITPGTTGTGVFKSTDGGATWNITGLKDTAVTVLAIDRGNTSVLYAGTQGIYTEPHGFRGLFKSTDGGNNWSGANNGLAGLSDIGATITAVVIAPNNSNVIYAGTSGGGVYKSADGGANWAALNDGLASRDIRALAVAPGAPNIVYAATAAGVFRIFD